MDRGRAEVTAGAPSRRAGSGEARRLGRGSAKLRDRGVAGGRGRMRLQRRERVDVDGRPPAARGPMVTSGCPADGADTLGRHALALARRSRRRASVPGPPAYWSRSCVATRRRTPRCRRSSTSLRRTGARRPRRSRSKPRDRSRRRRSSRSSCAASTRRSSRRSRTIAARFAGVAHEVIRIPDAASLCEGFNRGYARSRGDAVVYCHDDIDLLAPDAAMRLARHLTHADLGAAWRARRASRDRRSSGPDTRGCAAGSPTVRRATRITRCGR